MVSGSNHNRTTDDVQTTTTTTDGGNNNNCRISLNKYMAAATVEEDEQQQHQLKEKKNNNNRGSCTAQTVITTTTDVSNGTITSLRQIEKKIQKDMTEVDQNYVSLYTDIDVEEEEEPEDTTKINGTGDDTKKRSSGQQGHLKSSTGSPTATANPTRNSSVGTSKKLYMKSSSSSNNKKSSSAASSTTTTWSRCSVLPKSSMRRAVSAADGENIIIKKEKEGGRTLRKSPMRRAVSEAGAGAGATENIGNEEDANKATITTTTIKKKRMSCSKSPSSSRRISGGGSSSRSTIKRSHSMKDDSASGQWGVSARDDRRPMASSCREGPTRTSRRSLSRSRRRSTSRRRSSSSRRRTSDAGTGQEETEEPVSKRISRTTKAPTGRSTIKRSHSMKDDSASGQWMSPRDRQRPMASSCREEQGAANRRSRSLVRDTSAPAATAGGGSRRRASSRSPAAITDRSSRRRSTSRTPPNNNNNNDNHHRRSRSLQKATPKSPKTKVRSIRWSRKPMDPTSHLKAALAATSAPATPWMKEWEDFESETLQEEETTKDAVAAAEEFRSRASSGYITPGTYKNLLRST